jgi:hypothetical protein
MASAAAQAQGISWQDAVATLQRERTRAEACVRILGKYGDDAAKARGSLAYADSKSEYDAVIAGLITALARKQQPASLKDLEGRLQRGFEKREAFCNSIKPLVPTSAGQKGVIDEIVSGALGPIIQAVEHIYMRSKDDDALMRKTIQSQLEAAEWPAFDKVASSS